MINKMKTIFKKIKEQFCWESFWAVIIIFCVVLLVSLAVMYIALFFQHGSIIGGIAASIGLLLLTALGFGFIDGI